MKEKDVIVRKMLKFLDNFYHTGQYKWLKATDFLADLGLAFGVLTESDITLIDAISEERIAAEISRLKKSPN